MKKIDNLQNEINLLIKRITNLEDYELKKTIKRECMYCKNHCFNAEKYEIDKIKNKLFDSAYKNTRSAYGSDNGLIVDDRGMLYDFTSGKAIAHPDDEDYNGWLKLCIKYLL